MAQAEKGNSTAQDAWLNADKPVSTKGYVSDNKRDNVQDMKLNSFTKPNAEKTFTFKTLFYFINSTIHYSVIFRLRITYASKLRSLQRADAESVRTDCIITITYLAEMLLDDEGLNINMIVQQMWLKVLIFQKFN